MIKDNGLCLITYVYLLHNIIVHMHKVSPCSDHSSFPETEQMCRKYKLLLLLLSLLLLLFSCEKEFLMFHFFLMFFKKISHHNNYYFKIADEQKAVLLADIAHISGLIAAQVTWICLIFPVVIPILIFFSIFIYFLYILRSFLAHSIMFTL